jgi:hypothetical protein
LILNEKNRFLHLLCAIVFAVFDFNFGSESELCSSCSSFPFAGSIRFLRAVCAGSFPIEILRSARVLPPPVLSCERVRLSALSSDSWFAPNLFLLPSSLLPPGALSPRGLRFSARPVRFPPEGFVSAPIFGLVRRQRLQFRAWA